MSEKRVRIADIAEELGLSTATVSNVIHGKTKKISDETVKRVQELLEEREYIPAMAGILLSQNNSRIVGIVVNNHEKYEGRALEDDFISASLNALSGELDRSGYFMMIKVTKEWNEIPRFASMWNMEGLILVGFCENDYKRLRERMHIPFVVYDGFFEENSRICNLIVDNYDGGRQVGEYLRSLGHTRVLCIADNYICMDRERIEGCRAGMAGQGKVSGERGTETGCRVGLAGTGAASGDSVIETELPVDFLEVPMSRRERLAFYGERLETLRSYTAIFAVSDVYAIELMQFLQRQEIAVPEEISVVGFDNITRCETMNPALTTVGQNPAERARKAVEALKGLKEGRGDFMTVRLPARLIVRESTATVKDVSR